MAVDKPNINISVAQLEKEAVKPEPYVLALKSGKRVTFPDLYDRPADEAEEFLKEFSTEPNDFKALEKWLPKTEFDKYKAAKLPLRAHALLIDKVMSYYQNSLGLPGEDDASAS